MCDACVMRTVRAAFSASVVTARMDKCGEWESVGPGSLTTRDARRVRCVRVCLAGALAEGVGRVGEEEVWGG
eukprot:353128-Chlamydomonas_euryale.AAC.1